MKDIYFKKVSFRNFILLPLVCLVLSGCIGGCFVADVKFTSTLIKDAEIPASSNSIPLDNKEVQLAGVCGQFDMEKIREQLISGIQKLPFGSNILTRLVNNLKIKNLYVEKITITATQGNFNNISSLSLLIKIGNGEINFGPREPNDEKTAIVFQKDDKIDIYPYIKDFPDGGCVEVKLKITGYTNQEVIRFDVVADISGKISL